MDLVQHLEKDCELNKCLKCPSKDCPNQDLMTENQLIKHMTEECSKIEV